MRNHLYSVAALAVAALVWPAIAYGQNQPPVADAGPDISVTTGGMAYLDGTGSYDDTTPTESLRYAWKMVSVYGDKLIPALLDYRTATPYFQVGPVGAMYKLTLIVYDVDGLRSDADTVVVSVVDLPNEPPVADAGPDLSVRAGDVICIDGTNSSDDNTARRDLKFYWNIESAPAGSEAYLILPILKDQKGLVWLATDLPGTYEIAVVIQDREGLWSNVDTVLVSTDNLAPTAVATAANTLLAVGSVVYLDGTGSVDPEGDPLTYEWTLTAPAGSLAVLDDPASASPTFVTDAIGEYTATLTVYDFLGEGEPDSVTITVVSAEDLAQILIVDVSAVISELPQDAVTTGGNQNAALNWLSQAAAAIEEGDIDEAVHKLEQTIERTDGCALRGAPDGNGPGRDWITDCDVQLELYILLVSALDAIAP